MRTSRTTTGLKVALALLALGAPPAAAQGRQAEAERPWAQGIPQEKQEAALALFREANSLVKESIFVRAAEKYREALALWDHPAIHFNMALALINLDQPIEVHEHLIAAMRYGPEPLESDKFENAQRYKALIEKQLARVELTCDTPSATVTLDGQVLFVGPGRYEGLVRPGQHTLVATREGYVPTDVSRTLLPGESVKLELKLFTVDELTEYKRRWSAWKPWAVVGAGALVVAGGGIIHLQARNSFRDFDTGILSCSTGCVPTPELANKLTRGDNMQKLAFGTYAVGGAALITGAVLVYLNRSQAYRISPGELHQEPALSVTPLLGAGERGMAATLRF